MHQDEAINAWNAYCLLKTGTDQFGVPWPTFYFREFGGNRSTLFLYLLLPFQALGGLNVWTTRLPVALGGLLTILLLYYVASRLFDRTTGLAAAALLALSPLHVLMSRYGGELSLTPFLTLVPVAALLWAGFPLRPPGGPEKAGPVPWRSLAAGLLSGICCYGYPATRLFVPVFFILAAVATWPACWRAARTSRGRLGLAGFLLGFAITFGPLVYEHLAHADVVARRGVASWVWQPADPLLTRTAKVLQRYTAHFGPDFLLRSADADKVLWMPDLGFLPVYALPLALVGVGVALWRSLRKRDPGEAPVPRAARVMLAAVLAFPVGDSFNATSGDTLRAPASSPGLWILALAAAVGLVHVVRYARARRLAAWSLAVCAAVGLPALAETGRFFVRYVVHERQTPVRQAFYTDLLAACDWLHPRWAAVDAVVCTTEDFGQPWVLTLIGMHTPPREWLASAPEYHVEDLWIRWTHYGKWYFASAAERPTVLARLSADTSHRRILLLLRPDETPPGPPAPPLLGAEENAALLIYEYRPALQ